MLFSELFCETIGGIENIFIEDRHSTSLIILNSFPFFYHLLYVFFFIYSCKTCLLGNITCPFFLYLKLKTVITTEIQNLKKKSIKRGVIFSSSFSSSFFFFFAKWGDSGSVSSSSLCLEFFPPCYSYLHIKYGKLGKGRGARWRFFAKL